MSNTRTCRMASRSLAAKLAIEMKIPGTLKNSEEVEISVAFALGKLGDDLL